MKFNAYFSEKDLHTLECAVIFINKAGVEEFAREVARAREAFNQLSEDEKHCHTLSAQVPA